ncbi:MAG: hypothetical protein KF773_26850 [Deltaproteobacteria bacterium]|nr:hypothetical protein [Deltaproteobacteria bacterium]MCW5803490.1 hypothetical protein [Deltaproteobacteria bacterium]
MWEPSSRADRIAWLLLVGLVGACSKSEDGAPAVQKKPTADPAAAQKLAEAMRKNDPMPAAARECTPEDYQGVMTLTYPSVVKLAGQPVARDQHENADWINPYDLDHPSVRTLLDRGADATARGEAAAELLAAPSYLVYRVDLVDVGLVFEIKDLKRGIVGARSIKYDRNARLVCVSTFTFKNTKKVSEWGMDEAEKGGVRVNKVVVDKLREDLRLRYLRRLLKLGMPLPPAPPAPEGEAPPAAGDDE